MKIGDIQIGDYDVLDTGCVASIGGKPVLFKLTQGVNVKVVFDDQKEDKRDMKFAVNENGEFEITLKNFKNPLGTEFTNAVRIGVYQGRPLLLHLKVYGIEEIMNKTVIYTWLLGNDDKG